MSIFTRSDARGKPRKVIPTPSFKKRGKDFPLLIHQKIPELILPLQAG